MSRACILMMDSFGLGATADAAAWGDTGADTFRHIAEWCAQGLADSPGVRSGPLQIPHFLALGLGAAAAISGGSPVEGLPVLPGPFPAQYGIAAEKSTGKDTPSGHWEMAGVPVQVPWGYFPPDYPSFPDALLETLIQRCQLPGVLGNRHASGTVIIEALGAEHTATGKPIVYTSADSVFQIAAHEETFGLKRLYAVCEVARELVNAYHIGRVIARPFRGAHGAWYRTGNRRDYSLPPPEPTLLDRLTAAGGEVIAIGKIADIYAHRGITRTLKADGNMALFDLFLAETEKAPDHSLVFVNLVDFDMLYGHRRDVSGYAAALEALDRRLPEWQNLLKPGDLAVITADHGCDPTWPGSDHTREHVPVIAFGPGRPVGSVGQRETFADIGQTIAHHLGLPPLDYGTAF